MGDMLERKCKTCGQKKPLLTDFNFITEQCDTCFDYEAMQGAGAEGTENEPDEQGFVSPY